MIRWHVISAVFSRNLKQYFSGVLGYLFIVAFVTVCAAMAFGAQFFADNLANLDQLSDFFPYLLLFLIPAITMTVWAEEKRQGTDAILFTLPASDIEILLGKYLAVSAVYTIALLFSGTLLIALEYIGQPDWGVIATTYIGYWLAGLALAAIGMFASSLTNSATVAFVLGGVLCAIPVLVGQYFRGYVGLERFGFEWNLQDFTLGLLPLANVVYFLSIIVFMLYLNLMVISRRHWSRGQQASLGSQFFVRVVSLAVALVSLNYIVNQASSSLLAQLDLTEEKLYSLDPSTIETLQTAKENKRPVTVQAFLSRNVPRSFVNTKKQFEGLLRQYKLYGGNNVDVRFVDVVPNSDEELQAIQLGIEPHPDRSEIGGRVVEQDVYLGALVSSPQGDATLPFIDSDTSIEYKLTHSIATTTDKSRKITLGILETDTFFGGPEIQGRRVPWAYDKTLSQFKTQFQIKYIKQDDLASYLPDDNPADEESKSADSDVDNGDVKNKEQKQPPSVLLVPAPSSLTDQSTDALIKYIELGNPVVILADPLPFFWTSRNPVNIGVINAPRQPRISQQSPYTQVLAASFFPKADGGRCTRLQKALGIDFDSGQAAWHLDDPHPNFRGSWSSLMGASWPEYFGPYEKAFVFVRDHGDQTCFDKSNTISSGLKELLFFYPGNLRKSADSDLEFTPLITLESESGVTDWDYLVQTPSQKTQRINPRTGQITVEENKARSQITGDDLIVIEPNPRSYMDEQQHVLAAQIKGTGDKKINVVFIADLDFVSELYYEQVEALKQPLDNVTFLQNAIEVLAGDEAFVSLRNRRPTPRTLSYIEKETERYRKERAKKQEEAEKQNREQLQKEQAKLDVEAKKIEEDQSLSFFEKLQRTSQEASDAQRRFDLKKEKFDRDLKLEIDKLASREQNQIRKTESRVRWLAILLAPLPAIVLGTFVWFIRSSNERRQVTDDRRTD